MCLDSSSSDRVDRAPPGSPPLISVVVPVYKEENNIRPFLARLVPVLERLGTYEIIFALDPSPDGTERVIRDEIVRNQNIGLIVFSRRFGQPAATMAGILNCRGQWCAVIDVDLQDPPEVIEALWLKTTEGFDDVTARRASREGETMVKLIVARLGYRVINQMAEVPIPLDTGDFRIISRRVIEELRGLTESHGFLKGLVPFVGFPQAEVLYGSGGGGVAHDLEVEQALGALDPVDGVEQQGERAGLPLGNKSGKGGSMADQAGG